MNRKNLRHPAANLFATSVSGCWWNVIFLPRYFCDAVWGRISTLRSLMRVCSGCCLGFLSSWLCMILVLSGCSSRPTFAAASCISLSIKVIWRRLVANNITSSAKRMLVRCCSAKSNFIPHPRRCHSGNNCRKMCSERVLKRRELSGSPCLVPRSILNSLLDLSVRTVAVWLL